MFPRTFMGLLMAALFLLPAAYPQRGTPQTPSTPPPDRTPTPRGTDSYYSTNDLIVHGEVALADGSAPRQFAVVDRVCNGTVQTGGFADAKGHFSFNLGSMQKGPANGSIVDTISTTQLAQKVTLDDLKPCQIRASLPGYRSQSVPLVKKNVVNTSIGTLALSPVGSRKTPTSSAKDDAAPKNARKAFEKGMNSASRAKWKEAIDALQSATAAYPEYVSAWVSLGMLQEGVGDFAGARNSYQKAVAADSSFPLAYLQAAVADAALGHWPDSAANSAKVIELDPESFPRAYYLNAIANLRLRQYADAEKSATTGLKVDEERRFPDLEYALGMARVGQNDRSSAVQHLRSYLSLAPQGGSAAAAKQQLLMLGVAVD